jgi:2-oxoglutarate ferredoxin oxidoreductase subunit alpha
MFIKAPITNLTRAAVQEYKLDLRTTDKMRNQFVAGMLYWLFNRDLESGISFIRNKFKKKPELEKPNITVLRTGYDFAETIEAKSSGILVKPSEMESNFRNITVNQATAGDACRS